MGALQKNIAGGVRVVGWVVGRGWSRVDTVESKVKSKLKGGHLGSWIATKDPSLNAAENERTTHKHYLRVHG